MAFAKSVDRKRMDAELSSAENDPSNNLANSSNDLAQASVKCPHCGAVFAADAAFCPDCKWPMTPLTLEQRAAAAVAYFPLLPAVVILYATATIPLPVTP